MKQLTVEWQRLVENGDTCDRCQVTGDILHDTIERLNRECQARGWEIRLTETALGPESIANSNRILVDGKPLETFLPGAKNATNHCRSCSEMIGTQTQCRTLEWAGGSHETIPESLLRRAICRVAACC